MSEAVPINCVDPVVIADGTSVTAVAEGQDRPSAVAQESVLVVDLDGTLVRCDLLHEAFVRSAVRSPLTTTRLCLQLTEGRAAFKQALARVSTMDAADLPYRQEILNFLREERLRGRTIVLATASCREWAESVAAHLQLFDHVLATDGQRNLKGKEKLLAIREFCATRGFKSFAYIGDSWSDLPIWEQASEAFVATHHSRVLRALKAAGTPVRVFEGKNSSTLNALMRAARPHQWAKNAILFVPLIVSHRISEADLFFKACIAFLSFSLFASAVYILNDFADVDFDRRHGQKRHRPFAAGDLPLFAAIPLSGILFLVGSVLTYVFLPWQFHATLFVYFVVTTAYSLLIKRIMIGDVLVLAGLYVLRVFAGGTACDIPISDWLLTFSLFIFVSLGFLKRYVELSQANDDRLLAPAGRGYEVGDLSLIETMGISSGFMAVVVLALYLQSDQMRTIYRFGRPLWFLCPLLMYWLSRAWILARRRRMSHDPIVFALTDPPSLIIVAVSLLLLLLASIGTGLG